MRRVLAVVLAHAGCTPAPTWPQVEDAVVATLPPPGLVVPAAVQEEVDALVARGDRAALGQRVQRGEPWMTAGCLPLVEFARRDFLAGNADAAQTGHNLLLSSCPHRARLRGLRLLCEAGRPACDQQLALVESGAQDAAFQPALPLLRAYRAAAPSSSGSNTAVSPASQRSSSRK